MYEEVHCLENYSMLSTELTMFGYIFIVFFVNKEMEVLSYFLKRKVGLNSKLFFAMSPKHLN